MFFIFDLESKLESSLSSVCEGTPEECYYQAGAVCKVYNIEGYDCVREGYTGKGFLGLTDWDNEYYICKDLGRVARSCVDYYSYSEMMDLINNNEVQG